MSVEPRANTAMWEICARVEIKMASIDQLPTYFLRLLTGESKVKGTLAGWGYPAGEH